MTPFDHRRPQPRRQATGRNRGCNRVAVPPFRRSRTSGRSVGSDASRLLQLAEQAVSEVAIGSPYDFIRCSLGAFDCRHLSKRQPRSASLLANNHTAGKPPAPRRESFVIDVMDTVVAALNHVRWVNEPRRVQTGARLVTAVTHLPVADLLHVAGYADASALAPNQLLALNTGREGCLCLFRTSRAAIQPETYQPSSFLRQLREAVNGFTDFEVWQRPNLGSSRVNQVIPDADNDRIAVVENDALRCPVRGVTSRARERLYNRAVMWRRVAPGIAPLRPVERKQGLHRATCLPARARPYAVCGADSSQAVTSVSGDSAGPRLQRHQGHAPSIEAACPQTIRTWRIRRCSIARHTSGSGVSQSPLCLRDGGSEPAITRADLADACRRAPSRSAASLVLKEWSQRRQNALFLLDTGAQTRHLG